MTREEHAIYLSEEKKLKEGEIQVPNEHHKNVDTKGRFMKGNTAAKGINKYAASRAALTKRMLEHAASLDLTPEEVLSSLFTNQATDPELRFKAAKAFGEWIYYKAPNLEVNIDVEMDNASSIEDQVDLYMERSSEVKQAMKFKRIRKYGRDALGCTEEDFKAFEERYGSIPEGKKAEKN